MEWGSISRQQQHTGKAQLWVGPRLELVAGDVVGGGVQLGDDDAVIARERLAQLQGHPSVTSVR